MRSFSSMARVLCGDDDKCLDDLGERLRLYKDLHELVEHRGSSFEPRLSSRHPPLVERVENAGDLSLATASILKILGWDVRGEKALEALRGEADLEDHEAQLAGYVARRLLFKAVRRILGDEIPRPLGGRCPVCGLYPFTGISRKIDEGVFSRSAVELRCLCGNSWISERLRCPRCGSSRRESLEMVLINGTTYQVCRSCGHVLGILEGSPLLDEDLAHVIISYGLPLALSQSGGEPGPGGPGKISRPSLEESPPRA